MAVSDTRVLSVLALAAVTAAWAGMTIPRYSPATPGTGDATIVFHPGTAFIAPSDSITIENRTGRAMHLSLGGGEFRRHGSIWTGTAGVLADRYKGGTMPTAMQWRHPLPGRPKAVVIRAFEELEGRASGVRMATYLFKRHVGLPVISIATAQDGLYGEEHGILVPGDFILDAPASIIASYARDPRWWKYPGNYHGRGKEWERRARVQLLGPAGEEVFQVDAGLRISGQMTRGFPQHALRMELDEPLRWPVFDDGDGRGARSLVLRAAGNDQVKGMMRDAFQHELCAGQGFLTSKSLACVAYINGEYQGLRYLRQRMDDRELSRIHGEPRKRFTILEDQNELYRGDSAEARAFLRIMSQTEKWDALDPAWMDSLESRLDVDGFLRYMASQMILGNMDWPRQNVKYWRYTGKPKAPPLDGRWYFIMGDSDLGFGANAPVSADIFVKVRPAHVPVSRLFLAMMRSAELKQRFVKSAQDLLDGPLSAERCTSVLADCVGRIEDEMPDHLARWRKPATIRDWRAEVDVLMDFARNREGHVRRQLEEYLNK